MDAVRDQLVGLLQDYLVEAHRLRQELAERNRMHPTDLYAFMAVLRGEAAGNPFTPGRLGAHLGLSSGATTAVLDRLARLDLVERVPDDVDRRRTTLRVGAAAQQLAETIYPPLRARADTLLTGFSARELTIVLRFLEETNEALRAHRKSMAVG